jgi:protein-S-isoprenylcysteine O-methyltransferase Ste14
METLKKVVTNQYFPAGAVLTAVVLFWVVAMFGGLSLLNNNQPPLTTLTWMLFVYAAAVLTPLAGLLAAVDLVRRWRRNRTAAPVQETSNDAAVEATGGITPSDPDTAAEASQPAEPQASQSAPTKPQRPGRQEAA